MSKTEWHGCSYPQYDALIHIKMLHEVYKAGHGVAEFCKKADISRVTFKNWLEKYPEFKENHDMAIESGRAIWEDLPREYASRGLTINHNYWVCIMRNRYKYFSNKIKKEKENTTSSRLEAVWESFQEGELTAQEYNQLASGLSSESKITEIEIQRQMVNHMRESATIDRSMTDKAIKAYMLVKSGKGEVIEIP